MRGKRLKVKAGNVLLPKGQGPYGYEVHIDGDKIDMEVLNPDTLEKVDELKLK